MESTAEILMSTKELGCRRANSQCQRYLNRVVTQYDMEKKLVERDWNNRMKALLKQKQRLMPQSWDTARPPRPKTAWASSDRCSSAYHVMSKNGRDHPTIHVPEHWTLLSSYRVTSNGQRILKQRPSTAQQEQEGPPQLSARPVKQRGRARRAASAPVQRARSPPRATPTRQQASCLVTQLNNNTERLSIDTPLAKHSNVDLNSDVRNGEKPTLFQKRRTITAEMSLKASGNRNRQTRASSAKSAKSASSLSSVFTDDTNTLADSTYDILKQVVDSNIAV